MIGRLLCFMGFYKKPDDSDVRFLWFCRRRHCGQLQAPLRMGKPK